MIPFGIAVWLAVLVFAFGKRTAAILFDDGMTAFKTL
jgi:hypothetical protein